MFTLHVSKAKKILVALWIVALLIFSLQAFPFFAHAASLSVTPNSGTFDEAFTIHVSVSSVDQALNAISGRVTYPSDLLEPVSVSTNGTIVHLWSVQPTVSDGVIPFAGVVLNPGFMGERGHILSVTFKPRASGSATISLAAAQVLANDGYGTGILNQTSSASYQITVGEDTPTKPVPTEPTPTPAPVPASPGRPVVNILTEVSAQAWYQDREITFSWSVPRDITDVSFVMNRQPQSDPGNRAGGVRSTYTHQDLEDGEWFFHIKFRNAHGWGPVTHLPFRVDATPPEVFEIEEISDAATWYPKFLLKGSDTGSGISHYEIVVNGGDPLRWSHDVQIPFSLENMTSGTHVILFRAIDNAGNIQEIERSIVVKEPVRIPIVLLEGPSFTTENKESIFRGTATPGGALVLRAQNARGRTWEIRGVVDDAGNFRIVLDALRPDVYQVDMSVTDMYGRVSSLDLGEIRVTHSVQEKAMLGGLALGICLIVLIFTRIVLALAKYELHLVRRTTVKNHFRKSTRRFRRAFGRLRKDTRHHFKKDTQAAARAGAQIDRLERDMTEAVEKLK